MTDAHVGNDGARARAGPRAAIPQRSPWLAAQAMWRRHHDLLATRAPSPRQPVLRPCWGLPTGQPPPASSASRRSGTARLQYRP